MIEKVKQQKMHRITEVHNEIGRLLQELSADIANENAQVHMTAEIVLAQRSLAKFRRIYIDNCGKDSGGVTGQPLLGKGE